ncbi:MAG TPA: tetratricopeptide repeat protein [Pyrinomonadaceae bacterium]|jgi:tetratricopeptide (TPR) repeat protein|nr:tetratricopeptide repeat protein [Pyrinomonadaceae bacterium]
MSTKTVFISYSHDSAKHQRRVLALSERLRADGIKTILDQYLNGSPLQGWPRWMLDQMDEADSVLVICTRSYYRRFRGHEQPGKGKGGDWEGALITQEIYDSRSRTKKFVPVIFSPADEKFIPEPLRAITYFTLTSEAGYQTLYDSLLDQAGVQPRRVGKLKKKARAKGQPLAFDQGSQRLNNAQNDRRSDSTAATQSADAIDSYRRAIRLLSDGEYEEALAAFNQAIDQDPTLALAFYNRGLTQYYKREDDAAIADYNRSLELGFNDAIVFRNRANSYSRMGDVARALADYAQAIALEPGNALAYLNRGEVYENTLQKDLAIADYKTVLTLVCEESLKEEGRRRLTNMGVKIAAPSPALAIWQKKLAFLQAEEAKASDADQKFSIQERIEEAQAKIRELGD